MSGLTQRSDSVNNRVRPLQASTNTIHTKIPKRVDNLIHERARLTGKQIFSEPTKKEAISNRNKLHQKIVNQSKQQTPKIDENAVSQYATEVKPSSSSPVKKTDENDLSEFVNHAYNPLDDIYGFDEELYQRILKLEIADDGLPTFKSDEPFDF